MTRYLMLLYQGLKKIITARMNLTQRLKLVDVAVLYILAAALILVASAGMLVFGVVKDYRAEKLKAGEMVPAVNIGQSIQKIDISPAPSRPAGQQEQSNVTGIGSSNQADSRSVSSKQEKIIKPLSGAITVGYGWREDPLLRDWRYHSGINIEAPLGTEVKAALSGKVTSVKREHNGMIVKTTHESGRTIVYGNLQKCYIETGQFIDRGEIVGVVGEASLHESGLHFEVWQNNKSVDPQSLIEW